MPTKNEENQTKLMLRKNFRRRKKISKTYLIENQKVSLVKLKIKNKLLKKMLKPTLDQYI